MFDLIRSEKPTPSHWPCHVLTLFFAHHHPTQETEGQVTSAGGESLVRGAVRWPLAAGVTPEVQTLSFSAASAAAARVYSAGESGEQCCLLKPRQPRSRVAMSAWGKATPSPKTSHRSVTAWVHLIKAPPQNSLQTVRFTTGS